MSIKKNNQNNFQMANFRILLLALLLLSCKKEKVKTCYQCQVIAEGKYIANVDTCTAQVITNSNFVCKIVK